MFRLLFALLGVLIIVEFQIELWIGVEFNCAIFILVLFFFIAADANAENDVESDYNGCCYYNYYPV